MLTIFRFSKEDQEQSLSRRDVPGSASGSTVPPGTPPPDHPPPGHPPQGSPPPDYRPNGPPPEAGPPKGPDGSLKELPKEPPKVEAKGSNVKTYALNFLVGTVATMAGVSILKGLGGLGSSKSSAAASSSTTPPTPIQTSDPNAPSYVPYPNYMQYQNSGQQSQRRAVDRKRVDFFGEPHSKSWSINNVTDVLSPLPDPQMQSPDPFRIIIGKEKVREYPQFFKHDHRRATSHLELLSRRADLGEALKLFSRVLDELD